jgi:hypothetical protein
VEKSTPVAFAPSSASPAVPRPPSQPSSTAFSPARSGNTPAGCSSSSSPEAVDAGGEYTLGPVEYNPDGGTTCRTLYGTVETNQVAGTGLPSAPGSL